MTLAAQPEVQHIGQTAAMADHDFDLVQELEKRAANVWRCDQYIANADGKPELQSFWRQLKDADMNVVEQLRGLVRKECREDCF
jgi:hypothetical protein